MRKIMLVTCLLAFLLPGCDPVGRHKVLSTLFDGVPSLPPPEQLCKEYADKQVAEVKDQLSGKKAITSATDTTKSQHAPYQEKKCNDCHDKRKQNGLIADRTELCLVCHAGFIKGPYVHGPVAVGDCQACHLPHSSNFPALLKSEKSALCSTCHREKRVASAMHDKVSVQKIGCTDCHDPHFGNASFFLK